MMNFLKISISKTRLLIVYTSICFLILSSFGYAWGFYGHRKINEMAVYCLPGEMINLFKKNIEYISQHAVDPDKRRYATPFEAVRHYIDIDHWGDNPFEDVPRNYAEAVTKYGICYLVNGVDSTILDFDQSLESKSFQERKKFIINNWLPQRYEEMPIYLCDSLIKYFDFKSNQCSQFLFEDVFSTFGILPYELESQQRKLTDAFLNKDAEKIIRVATDIGHYIADAHVPLHTTENYNGQMTNQDGIHAFWESRLPELFADSEYDFFVGQADYVLDKKSFFWNIVEESNRNLQKVLDVEMKIRNEYDQDKQYCYEERLDATIRLECSEYAKEYHELLGGMVEDRMRGSIKSIADCWYTAWVDAGQPDFDKVEIISEEDEIVNKAFDLGKIFGRKH